MRNERRNRDVLAKLYQETLKLEKIVQERFSGHDDALHELYVSYYFNAFKEALSRQWL